MALTRVAPAGIGSTPGTGYVIGDSFLHSTGLNATNAYYTGIVTTQTLRVIGDFQVDGTTTTLDTEVTSVDKLEVAANNNTVGVAITQSGTGDIFNLYDGSTEVFSVTDGGKVKIGTTTEGQTEADDLTIATSGHTGMTIRSGETSKGAVYFADGTSGNSEFAGYVEYNHQSNFLRFGTASAEKVRITSAGKVGVGVASPLNTFHVYGANTIARFQSSTSYVDLMFQNTGATNGFIQYNNSGNFRFFANSGSTPTLTITGGAPGSVGVGTVTPGHKLEVAYTSDDDGFVINHANRGGKWRFATSGSNAELFDIRRYDGANSTFRRYLLFGPDQFSVYTGSTTSATERFRITSTGNVGIKTASPLGDFSVLTDSNGYFTVTGSGGNGAELRFHKKSDKSLTYSIQNNGGANELVQHVLAHSSGRYSWSIGGTERLRITSAGELNLTNGTINLGTADSSSGHINAYELMTFNIDSDNDDTNRHFTWYKNGASGGGTGMMRLDENGRLVIGGDLATSANNLTLKHATGVEIDMHATSGSGNNFRIKSDSNGTFTIRDHSAGADRLTITDAGYIGVGVANPSQKFMVKGIIASEATNSTNNWMAYCYTDNTFRLNYNGAGADEVLVTSDGKVGIGDNNPSEKLNVAGNIMLEGAEGFMYLSNVGTGNAGIYVRGNSSGSFLRSHSTGMFTWEVTGSEKMRLDATGNLGLGCSPGNSAGYRTLQIGDGTNTGGQIWLKNGANANYYNWHDGTGTHFYGQSATNLRFYTAATERFRIDSVGRAILGRHPAVGGGTYYDDLTINNSNTASGENGGAGIDLVSGNNSWGGYIFSDSDHHARGYLKYDHGDDNMVFGTSGSNRIILDSDGKLILSSTARETPFITGDGGMCIEQNYDGNLRAFTIRNKSTNAAAGTALAFSLNRTGGDQDFLAGEIKLIKDQSWTTTSSTVDGSMVFSTIYNGVLAEKLRISADGSLKVENSDYNDLIGCTGEHSGEPNSQYKTNSKTNLTSGTWYTIAVLPSGRGFASFMIQDLASSRHTCFYFNAGSQYGGASYQNCINVIGASGTHGTQVFGAVRIKAYGTYDGAMLQVYIQNSVSSVQAFMVGENLAPQRWRMRDWIPDGTDPTGLSNWGSINTSGSGLSAYADLAALSAGGASFSGHVLPGLDNTYHLGSGNRRWGIVYATTSAINTSDITLKRDVTVLNDAEMRAAARISKKFKQYRWNDSYAEKGNDARYHSGIMAQTVRDEMLAEGLDPTRYGFYCVDTWYEDSEGTRIKEFYPAGQLVDEDDPAFNTPDVGEPEIPENMSLVTRHSLRYEELLCFIAAYNEQRFASLESRLSALES